VMKNHAALLVGQRHSLAANWYSDCVADVIGLAAYFP
jgi:hypothetical protein